MAKKPRVLDSWAMLAFFQNEPCADLVENIINEAHAAGSDLMMSVINVGEIWYNIARTHSQKQADSIIAELRTLRIAFIDADWDLTQLAAAFKTKGKISYADCFAAAVAKKFKADLVTGDPEFKQVESNEVKILWL
jgi:predicted nucleic acid-binding protein